MHQSAQIKSQSSSCLSQPLEAKACHQKPGNLVGTRTESKGELTLHKPLASSSKSTHTKSKPAWPGSANPALPVWRRHRWPRQGSLPGPRGKVLALRKTCLLSPAPLGLQQIPSTHPQL